MWEFSVLSVLFSCEPENCLKNKSYLKEKKTSKLPVFYFLFFVFPCFVWFYYLLIYPNFIFGSGVLMQVCYMGNLLVVGVWCIDYFVTKVMRIEPNRNFFFLPLQPSHPPTLKEPQVSIVSFFVSKFTQRLAPVFKTEHAVFGFPFPCWFV